MGILFRVELVENPRRMRNWLLVALFVAVVAPVRSEECDDGRLECSACEVSDGETHGLVTLHGWPRFAVGGMVASDLAHYFECPSGDPECANGDVHAKLDAFFSDPGTEVSECDDGDEICAYVLGVGSVPLVLILIGILCLLWGIVFFIGRCCCGRGCCRSCCEGGGCGKRYPTIDRLEYSPREKWCARILMMLFIMSVVGFSIAGMLTGAAELEPAAKTIVDSPEGLVTVIQRSADPMGSFVVNAGGGTLVTFMSDVNTTVADGVDVKNVNNQLQCVNSKLDEVRPVPLQIIGELEVLQAAVDSMPPINVTLLELVSLNDSIVVLNDTIAPLRAELLHLNDSVAELDATEALKGQIVELNGTMNALDPYPLEVEASLDQLETALPTTSQVSQTSNYLTDLNTNGTRTTADTLDTNEAYRTTLRTLLESMYNSSVAIPDTGALALSLLELNQTLDDSNENMEAITASMTAINTTLANLPNADDINELLGRIHNETSTFNATGLIDALEAMSSAIDSLPYMGDIIDAVDTIRSVEDVIPCMNALVGELETINETLIELPDSANDIVDAMEDVEETLDDALNDTTTLQDDLLEVNDTLADLPDMEEYIADARNMSAEVSDVNSDLDLPGLQDDVNSIESDSNDVDMNDLLTSVSDLKTTMQNPDTRPSASLIDNLLAFNETRTTLPGQISALLLAMDIWESGVCQGDTSVSCRCDDMSACNTAFSGNSATCDAATGSADPVCLMEGASTNGTYATISGAADVVVGELDAFEESIATKPDDTKIRSSLADMESNLNDVPDLNEKIQTIQDLEETLDGLPDLDDYVVQLDDVQSNVDSMPDLDELYADLVDLNDQLPELDDEIETLEDLDDSFPDEDDLRDALDNVQKVEDIMYRELEVWLDNITSDALLATWDDEGMRAMIERVVYTVDNMRLFWDNETTPYMDDLDLEFIDTLTTDEESKHGPVHFFATLATQLSSDSDSSSSGSLSTAGSVTTDGESSSSSSTTYVVRSGEHDRVTEDGDGNPYPEGEECWTSHCLHNEIEYQFTMGGNESLATIISLLFIYPLLIAFFGCLGMTCRWGACANVSGWMIAISLPWIMIIPALQLTPLVIGSDMCTSATSVGLAQVIHEEHAICNDTLSGEWLAEERMCRMELSSDSSSSGSSSSSSGGDSTTVDMDISGVYADIFARCAGGGAFEQYQSDLADAVRDVPSTNLNDTLDDMDDITLRPPLRGDVDRFGISLGDDLHSFIMDTNDVWGCDSLGGGLYQIKEAFCCDAGQALAWTIGSWTLIGFSMIFCGWTASVVGTKRFAKRTWGPIAEELDRNRENLEPLAPGSVPFGAGVRNTGRTTIGGTGRSSMANYNLSDLAKSPQKRSTQSEVEMRDYAQVTQI